MKFGPLEVVEVVRVQAKKFLIKNKIIELDKFQKEYLDKMEGSSFDMGNNVECECNCCECCPCNKECPDFESEKFWVE